MRYERARDAVDAPGDTRHNALQRGSIGSSSSVFPQYSRNSGLHARVALVLAISSSRLRLVDAAESRGKEIAQMQRKCCTEKEGRSRIQRALARLQIRCTGQIPDATYVRARV